MTKAEREAAKVSAYQKLYREFAKLESQDAGGFMTANPNKDLPRLVKLFEKTADRLVQIHREYKEDMGQ